VFEALPARFRGVRHHWRDLVGSTLAGETAMVGVTPEGALRVMAASDAARREILARADHLLASFNRIAAHVGARAASSIVCWVRTDLRPHPKVARPSAPRASLDPASEAQARRELEHLTDRPLAERLARIRAQVLAERQRALVGPRGTKTDRG
jgi:hypothetical protein